MRFEKVSRETFIKDMEKYGFGADEAKMAYDTIKIPERKTRYSAGYDFSVPVAFYLSGRRVRTIPTGIKCYFYPGEAESWHLNLYIRSSIGIKYGIILANGTGIIDADYYNNPDNEGDILIALHNTSHSGKVFGAGERVMQGIFELHGLVAEDVAKGSRNGGVGSTGA